MTIIPQRTSRLTAPAAWFSQTMAPLVAQGIWRAACQTLGLKPIRTKASTPQINGKAQRFIKTGLEGWTGLTADRTAEERNR